jgi:hypothetical protein
LIDIYATPAGAATAGGVDTLATDPYIANGSLCRPNALCS